jgi:hypothetical protein
MENLVTFERLQRNPAVEEAGLQDELMLFDPSTSKFFVLNRTMAFTWKRIGDGVSPRDIALAIEAEFDGIDRAQAHADIQGAIEELIALGLVQEIG